MVRNTHSICESTVVEDLLSIALAFRYHRYMVHDEASTAEAGFRGSDTLDCLGWTLLLVRSRSHGIGCLCTTEENSPERRIFTDTPHKLFAYNYSQVEEKNNRIQEILVDLGSDETFFRPKWLDVEQPEEVFNVSGGGESASEGK